MKVLFDIVTRCVTVANQNHKYGGTVAAGTKVSGPWKSPDNSHAQPLACASELLVVDTRHLLDIEDH